MLSDEQQRRAGLLSLAEHCEGTIGRDIRAFLADYDALLAERARLLAVVEAADAWFVTYGGAMPGDNTPRPLAWEQSLSDACYEAMGRLLATVRAAQAAAMEGRGG